MVWGTVIVVTLAQDENVVTATERVFENGNGALRSIRKVIDAEGCATHEENIRVVTGSLVGGRAVKVPFLELGNGSWGLVESHGF